MVEPPPGWTAQPAAAASAATADAAAGDAATSRKKRGAQADTVPSFEASPAIVHDSGDRPTDGDRQAVHSEASPAADLAATIDQPIETHLARQQDDAAPTPPRPPQLPKQAADTNDGPVLPGDAWVSANSRQWQQMALIIGGGLTGLLLAVAAFGYIISRGASPDPPIAASDGEGVDDQDQKHDHKQDIDNHANDAGEDGLDAVSPAAADGGDTTPAKVVKPAANDPVASDPGGSTDADSDPDADAVKPDAVKPDGPDKVAGLVNPFDLDAPTRSSPETDPAKPAAPEETPKSTDPLADDLGEFAPFLDDTPLRDLPSLDLLPTAGDAADKPDEPLALVDVPKEPLMPRPAPREVDVAAQLSVPIMGLQFESIPLIDYLRFLAQMSAVPITVDPELALQAPTALATPVSVNLSDSNIRAALEEVLRPRRLALFESEGHLRVAAADAESRVVTYSVGDLVGDGSSLERLADMATELIAPQSWEAAGGASSLKVVDSALVVAAPPATHFQILVFCEKLRLARGLAIKSSSNPGALFDLRSRRERAAAQLAKPLTINFVRPTPLVEIVPRLEKQSGLRILVDWSAIDRQGWNPDGLAVLTADRQPLGEALDAMLDPMDLTWRAVSADVLQITTQEAIAEQPEIEFHSVAGLLEKESPEALIERLEAALGPDHFRDSGGLGVIQFDAPSKCLIALLPQPQQQQLSELLAPTPAAE